MKHTCRFCAIRDDAATFGSADLKVAEDARFFAIPSIGSLVEGWTLIIPKQHTTSLRDTYTDEDFRSFVHHVAHTVTKTYGPVIAFEHGPNCVGSQTGCGTDHAHLHIVPFTALSTGEISSAGVNFAAVGIKDIRDHVGAREYLAFFDDILNNPGRANIALLYSPISQYFRHLIGMKLGLTRDEIDYRVSPRLDVAHASAAALAPAFECLLAHG